MTPHVVPSDAFDALAAGDGNTGGALRAGQRSKRLLLLHEVVSAARSRAPKTFAAANAEQAFAVFVEAQRRSPSRVDELLLQPHVGAWAMHCLRRLLSGNGIEPADLGHLGAISAVAALRADQAFEVTTYLREGLVMFPTFGSVRLGSMNRWCRVRSRSRGHGVELSAGDSVVSVPFEATQDKGIWLPLRRLHSSADGINIHVYLDDLDPYRDCGQLATTDRLDASAVKDWQHKLDQGWELLVEHHPSSASVIADGVTSFVPLTPSEATPELSATCHEAIGAVAMTPPLNFMALALALIHEFQHTKLSALLDLIPLLDHTPDELFYAPWRADPRPLRGLLHGSYAYLGLTGFWEVHRRKQSVGSDQGEQVANFEFALWRDQVARTLKTIQRSGRLTPPGQRFISGMRQRLSPFLELSVPTEPRSLARIACLDHETSWRLRNVRPNPEQVGDWADAWLAGKAPPSVGPTRATVIDGAVLMPSAGRSALFRHRLRFPTGQAEDVHGASPADLLLVDNRSVDAADIYRSQIARDPDDLASWAGLALAHRVTLNPATRVLTTHPEQVRTLHEAILQRTGTAPDPENLASWLSRGDLSAET